MLEKTLLAAKLGYVAVTLVLLVGIAAAIWIFQEVIRRPRQ